MAVGRTAKTLRLFITCEDSVSKKTVVRMYDRDMNNELEALKKSEIASKNQTEAGHQTGRNLNATDKSTANVAQSANSSEGHAANATSASEETLKKFNELAKNLKENVGKKM